MKGEDKNGKAETSKESKNLQAVPAVAATVAATTK